MDEQATPTLAPVPGIDLDEYKHTLLERFTNPYVGDTVARLCASSSDRIPQWLLPVIRAQLESDGEIRRSAAVVASWARYSEGVDARSSSRMGRRAFRQIGTAAAATCRQASVAPAT